jgi:hypothetical protein
MKTAFRELIVAITSLVLLAGCTAANEIASARASLDKAKDAGAATRAPGDYYMAEAYLDAAGQEVKEGDTHQARYFANQSGIYSGRALQKAGGGAK